MTRVGRVLVLGRRGVEVARGGRLRGRGGLDPLLATKMSKAKRQMAVALGAGGGRAVQGGGRRGGEGSRRPWGCGKWATGTESCR